MNNTDETRVDESPRHEARTSVRNAKKSAKIPKLPLIIIAAILLLGLIIAAIVKNNNNHNKTNENVAVKEAKKKIPELKKAVDEKPHDPGARYNLGSAYYATDDKEAAAREYQQAIKLDSKNASYYNNLGNTYRDLKKYKEAVAEYQKAIDLQPKHPNAYSNMAFVQMVNLNDPSAAVNTYDKAAKALEGAEKYSMLNMKASALEKANRKDEAKSVYNEVLQADPENATAKANLERLK